jgi:ABC-2 type transport system permease protein
MTRLVRGEVLKLVSTRTFWTITLGSLALVAAAVAALAGASTFSSGDNPARQVLAVAGPVQTFALLLGVLSVTSEFRHGTITPVLLVTPRRTPLLLAKLITLTAVGLILGLLAFGEAAAITLPILTSRHIASQLDAASLAGVIFGGAVATMLAAALGVGLGAAVRNQVGAVIAALGLLYVAEPLLSVLPGIGHAVQRFGPAGLVSGASGTSGFPSNAHLLGQRGAITVLVFYALVVVVVGSVLFRRRDLAA